MRIDLSKILDIYLHNKLVGKLRQDSADDLSFVYDPLYLAEGKAALSLSLPLQFDVFKGRVVKAFFSGLLPEGFIRYKLARYLGLSEKNSFALLKAIGGECAGAVSCYPAGEGPIEYANEDIDILDDIKLKEILELVKHRPLLVGEDKMRLSLAGAQSKLAVGFKDSKIFLIKDTRPTTHILKPLIEEVTDSVYNELFCMRLAKTVGIQTAWADIYMLSHTPCYIVERYDRVKTADGSIMRLHQEDFCQVLGILPEIKYECEGGPNLAQCQNTISTHSAHPAADQIHLLNRIIFNYLIGNADAHGKNFSLLYKRQKPELAPAYDLLSTAVHPHLSEKMAMKIGGKYKPNEVFMRHWHKIVADTKSAKRNLEKQLLLLSHKTLEQAYALKDNFEKSGINSPIFAKICKLIETRSKRIRNQLNLPPVSREL